MIFWQHVMLGSRCSWLPGDERGFRNRGHRVHSSGDYKNRPLRSEHEGLRKFNQRRSGRPVNFRTDIRIIILREFVNKMGSLNLKIIAASIGKRHLHALVEIPGDYREMKKVIGKCKQKSSHAVRKKLPGNIWAEGCEFNRINDRGHLHNSYGYIRTKREAGTVVWSHNPEENWIDNPLVGIIVMGLGRKHLRIFNAGV